MINKIRSVSFLNNYIISANFLCGTTKRYDIKPLFEEINIFNKLKENNLFLNGKVDVGGYGIVWDDEVDLSADEIWENGSSIM